MRPVAPRLVGVDEETLGAESDTYLPITVGLAATDAGSRAFVTRWRLSADDRTRIAAGEDMFLFITAAHLPPVQLHVGSPYHELDA